MKVIVLAAGKGTRLRPLTDNRPKCMVELLGKPLIEHQLNILNKHNIDNIYVATGYLEDKIEYPEIKGKFFNPDFDKTNMVVSLFKALPIMEGEDLLITYGDIVYNEDVLKKVLEDRSEIGVVVDLNWKPYWEARMEDPLSDAETLKLDDLGNITELGKKASSYEDVSGQYIGMIKIRKDFVSKFISFYNSLDKTKMYDGNDFENMYMTSFLQKLTEDLIPLKPIYINNGWMEIDEPEDLEHTEFYIK
ncbi:NTP transferase domain-containing protein [Xanthomarina gelatinilytica]|uniref:phosphocholine cytidylyltransferase family protein n=1 Tax=Xanthomarina gelatinilytica TaxID=1137281 RepID=UPI003AA85490